MSKKKSITNVTQNEIVNNAPVKRRGKAARNLLLAGTALGAIGYGAWQAGRTRFTSKINGKLKIEGVKASVEIIRDKWGIPHIFAQNSDDLFFAQGFVQAQDRFWQMELNRRIGSGRIAEIVGEAALEADRLIRRYGLREAAHYDYAHADEDEKQILHAFANGVNAFLKLKKLPVEFSILRYTPEEWSAIDSLTWLKVLAFGQSNNFDVELLRTIIVQKIGAEKAAYLEPSEHANMPLIVTPELNYSGWDFSQVLEEYGKLREVLQATAGSGSNSWAVSGAKSVTGKPLLANDPHMSVATPANFYEMHLHAPGWNVIGATLPGVPGVIIGHNEFIAWGLTNTMADYQDGFIEKVDPLNSRRYEYKGEWRDFEVRREEIKIKGKPPVTEEILTSVHGPVISKLNQSSAEPTADASNDDSRELYITLKWTLHDSQHAIKPILGINQSKNWQEFRQACRDFDLPAMNITYADVDGNIGYQFAGRIPIRGKGLGKIVSPGHTGEYDWTGYILFDELPHVYNPPNGYVITANNRQVGNDYPYFLGSSYVSRNRAERIRELLTAKEKFSLDDFNEMLKDVYSSTAMKLARRLVQLDFSQGTDRQRRALAYLATWDGHLATGSIAAGIVKVTSDKLMRLLFEPLLGKDLAAQYIGSSDSPFGPVQIFQEMVYPFVIDELDKISSKLLPDELMWDEVLREAFIRATNFLTEKHGQDMSGWEWGKLHTLSYNHPMGAVKPLDRLFNRGTFPLPGDGTTVWQTGHASKDGTSFIFNGATSSIRLLADLGDLKKSRFGNTSGQSGSPFSPHYADFIEDWLEVKTHPLLFNREEILANAEGTLIVSYE
jgi:penicillin G amidase